jgi:sporulation protein YlmC with PRC-barrel domain
MERELTARDEGKPVVDSNGERIGTVTAVEDGSAHIDPDQGLVDEIKSQLGWGSPDEDSYPLPQGRITEVADDEIRLDIG